MTLANKVQQFSDDADLVHGIVHGPASGTGSTVTTEGGGVRTLAKLVADTDAAAWTQLSPIVTAAQDAMATASAQARLATVAAAAASTFQAQDLSGVTAAALHRSPNAITALHVYDTSKDSDGGAWVRRCAHTSWFNEALQGAWLGHRISETAARINAPSAPTGQNWQAYNGTLGAGFVDLPGTGSNGLFLERRAEHTITGDLDLRARVALNDWTPAAQTTLIASWVAGLNSFQFTVETSGVLRFTTSDGTNRVSNSTVGTGFADGSVQWVRVTYRSSDGQVIFYTSADGSTWSQLGATVTHPITGVIGNQTGGLAFQLGATGAANDSARLAGKLYYAEVRNGINGTAVARFDGATVTAASTGDYFQSSADGNFYSLNAGSGTTQVYRGNKREFPRLAAIVCEAANLTIYDLTEAGRPMWGRFIQVGGASGNRYFRTNTIVGVTALNGVMCVARSSNSDGLLVVNFPADRAFVSRSAADSGNANTTTKTYVTGLADRNLADPLATYSGQTTIVSGAVGGVAMTVLRDAPVDPATGLRVPTIAVATQGGVSVIQHSGTVRNSSSTANHSTVTILANGDLIGTWGNGESSFYYGDVGQLGASFASLRSINSNAAPQVVTGVNIQFKFLRASRWGTQSVSGVIGVARLNMVRHFPGNAAGLSASIDFTGTTGWMTGDARRCYLGGISAGTVSNPSTIANRSTLSASATVYGSLVGSAVASGAQLVGYSGWSAANYLQEPYNAGLDFGTGAWTVTAWASIYAALTSTYAGNFAISAEMISNGDFATDTVWSKGTGWTISGGKATKAVSGNGSYLVQGASVTDRIYRVTFTVSDYSAGTCGGIAGTTSNAPTQVSANGTYTHYVRATNTGGVGVWGSASFVGSIDNVSVVEVSPCWVVDRSAASGAYWRLGVDIFGCIIGEAHDGATTRTVRSVGSYNDAAWRKVRATYSAGTLSILVDGVQVASTTGAALLTLNNASAVLTIGNSRALDAPFPGSIALLKMGATVPTAEQAAFMFAQERAMFQPNAAVALPLNTAVSDLAYDVDTDRVTAVQGAQSSEWSGLVRVGSIVPRVGTFTRGEANAGVTLLARSTTLPGVDVTIPAQNLRAELVNRAEAAARRAQLAQVFDFDATTGQTDFTLPVGYEAVDVRSAGAIRREGSTRDWVRVFDGFRETVRFAVAPGNGVWVQITARGVA